MVYVKAVRVGKKRAALLFLVIAAALFSACTSGRTGLAQLPDYVNGTVQNTEFGKVQGAVDGESNALIFKGIPYGKAPEGELRWKAPVDPESWEGILDATRSGNMGIQAARGGDILGSEDCLNLDIYRPNSDEQGLPVLFYIHGGNNQTGASGELNARYLSVLTDSVVVSVNYRLGLLGFNNLPALRTGDRGEDSGNYTILDIAKALDWGQANIGFFGGNPGNVTISGFSAGGRDVMALLISPVVKGKFHKAISFSGGMTLADSDLSTSLIAGAIAPLVVEDGMKTTEEEAAQWIMSPSEDVKDYLYSLPADRLAPLMANAGIRMAVFPHLFNDGYVLPEEGFVTKKYNDVPLIMVTGSQEFTLFSRWDMPFVMYPDEVLLGDTEEAKNYRFVKEYGGRLYELFNAQESAEKMFDSYDAPIYTVDFDFGNDPEVVGEGMAGLFGSFHGIWIPFLAHEPSGFSSLFPDSFESRGARELADKFTAYIGNFLWEGNPNGEDLVTWESWTSADSGPAQLRLDATRDKAVITMSRERENYGKILEDMEKDTSVSEEVKAELIKTTLSGRWFSKGLDGYFGNSNLWVGVE